MAELIAELRKAVDWLAGGAGNVALESVASGRWALAYDPQKGKADWLDLHVTREGWEWLKLAVEPLEFMRYHVSSKSCAGAYLVDLSEYHGHGKCGCQHFQYRMEPQVKERKAGQPLNYDWMCDHLKAARFHFTNEVLLRLSLEKRRE